jgi:glycogen operon protein
MDKDLFSFTSKLIHFRLEHPVFCRKKWFQYKPIKGRGVTDIEWFLPEGFPMSDEHWNTTFAKSLSIYLSGYGLDSATERGERIVDDTFLMLINSDEKEVIFTLPDANWGKSWFKILETADNFFDPGNREFFLLPSENVIVKGMSIVLMIQEKS